MKRRKRTIQEIIEEIWAADDITILRLRREGRDACYIAKRVPLTCRQIMNIINVYEETGGFNPRTEEFMLDKLDRPQKNRRRK